jgi:hypothetical protein
MEQNYGSPKKQGYDLAKAQSFITSYKTSGLSQPAFCRLHKIKHSTFKNWLYRSEKSPLSCPDQSFFTPLKISDPASQKPLVPVIPPDLQILQGRWTINIPVGFDDVTLIRLLKLLEI